MKLRNKLKLLKNSSILILMTLLLTKLPSNVYAADDLLTIKYNYCKQERDEAERTLDICDTTLEDCKKLTEDLNKQIEVEKKIIDIQKKEVVDQTKAIDKLEKSKVTHGILFTALGIVVGLVLHVPLALFVK